MPNLIEAFASEQARCGTGRANIGDMDRLVIDAPPGGNDPAPPSLESLEEFLGAMDNVA